MAIAVAASVRSGRRGTTKAGRCPGILIPQSGTQRLTAYLDAP